MPSQHHREARPPLPLGDSREEVGGDVRVEDDAEGALGVLREGQGGGNEVAEAGEARAGAEVLRGRGGGEAAEEVGLRVVEVYDRDGCGACACEGIYGAAGCWGGWMWGGREY